MCCYHTDGAYRHTHMTHVTLTVLCSGLADHSVSSTAYLSVTTSVIPSLLPVPPHWPRPLRAHRPLPLTASQLPCLLWWSLGFITRKLIYPAMLLCGTLVPLTCVTSLPFSVQSGVQVMCDVVQCSDCCLLSHRALWQALATTLFSHYKKQEVILSCLEDNGEIPTL